ncbi:MAG: dethiobiotin synthase, partial [bacterium]|nr:dethiobiotin synthase [bacterium]
MKNIFIAATRQNDGKTVISIGLFLALKKYTEKIGFIKPVGQKYVNVDGKKVDKDAVLIKKICKLEDNLEDMSPIAVEEGFTRNYLDNPNKEELIEKIISSYKKISENKDIVLIEGTGHAGVGSIFDLNNAEVAKILDSPVIIISIGGIGKPADEISLNLALFKEKNVPVKGIIINKIQEEKKDVLEKYLNKFFSKINLKILGLVPYEPYLIPVS